MNVKGLRPRVVIAVVLGAVLLPLTALPPNAAIAAPTAIGPERLDALPADKVLKNVPEAPKGDFTNPLALDAKTRHDAGLHFDPNRSVLESSDERSEVFKNPDGTKTARIHAIDINWKDDKGNWHTIDSSLEASKDGRLRAKSVPVDASIASSTDDDDLVTLREARRAFLSRP